ncbi:MAG: hypothetical protein JW888_14610 [Pirellulales bacterium]|nr:hypothetical protein [Pirellulales bacterium]
MKTLLVGLIAIAVAFVSSTAGAAVYDVSVVGDGRLVTPDNFVGIPVGPASLTFSYDTSDFLLSEIFDPGDGRTGSIWTPTSPIPLTLTAGGVNYSIAPLSRASIFDQPTSFDQFNFRYGGSILMQWNDYTSSAWAGPMTTDFDVAHALLLDQLATNPSLQLANGGLWISTLNGDHELALRIENADVTFAPGGVVPEPCSFLIWSLLAAFAVAWRRRWK